MGRQLCSYCMVQLHNISVSALNYFLLVSFVQCAPTADNTTTAVKLLNKTSSGT